MAINDTPWCGLGADKLYLQSGQFTSTLKTSESIGGIDGEPSDISYDGTNTPWCGSGDDKLYLTSGQFTSTLKTSEYIGGIDVIARGMSWDGTDSVWCGIEAGKLYLQSGQFTSTLKTSEAIGAIDNDIFGISSDDTNTPWVGNEADKLYLTSGRFTSTLKDSENLTSIDTTLTGISYDGTDTPWCGAQADKLYLQSGQFTSTLKTSQSIGGIDSIPSGIDTNDVNARLGAGADITVFPSALTLTAGLESPTPTNFETVAISSALSLSLAQESITVIIGADITVTPNVLAITGAVNALSITSSLSVQPLALALVFAMPSPTVISHEGAAPTVLTLSLALPSITIVMTGSIIVEIAAPLALTTAILAPVIISDVTLLLPGIPMIVLEASLSLHAPEIGVTDDIKIVVTNARTFAISEYSAFAFNSMAKFNGKYLYAKADGIYEGGGDDDNGAIIDASYKTGAINIYATEIQRLRDAYLNFRSNGDIQLFSVGNEVNTRVYDIANSTSNTMHERRQKFERGIKDNHFSFGISNKNGSSFEIKSAKILTEPIRKRR